MSPMSPRLLRPRATGFTPRNLSGLVAWFDADDAGTFTLSGTEVSEWRDKSGNGYAVSQSTANNRPARTGTIGGRACIDFDGTNDCLFSDGTGASTFFSGDQSLTWFCVGQMQTADEIAINQLGTWLSLGSSLSGTPFLYMRSNANDGTFQLAVRNDANSQSGGISTGGVGPAGDGSSPDTNIDTFIVSATVPSQSNSVLRAHTNMLAEGAGIGRGPLAGSSLTSPAARPAGALTSNRFTIAALGRNVFSDFFPGRIGEIIMYSRVLSAAERGRVVDYLGKKYNLATPVI
jgi:hypothetical protein